jgi:hypothetical protein
MSFLGRDGAHQLVFYVVVIFFSTLSSLSSLANIYLIHDMKIWNGHILLIYSMAWSQFIYDISFAPGVITIPSDGVVITANVFQLIGGLSVAIFSNIMSIVVLYVIKFRISIDIMKYYKYYILGISFVVVGEVILYLISELDPSFGYLADIALLGIYYYFRLASIGLNFLACGLSYLYVRRMERMIVGKKTIQEEAICLLSKRMQFYPLVQAISRAGLAWYEFVYGWDFDPATVSVEQFICQMISAMTTPAASVGYLAIMLVMQPKAYATFRGWFIRLPFKSNKDDDLFISSPSMSEQKSDATDMKVNELIDGVAGQRLSYQDVRTSMAAFNEEELCQIIDSDYIDRDYSFSANNSFRITNDANIGVRSTNRVSQINPIQAQFDSNSNMDSNL